MPPSGTSKETGHFIEYLSLAMIMIATLILSFLINNASQRVRTTDKEPELTSLTPAVAVQVGESPTHVKVGLYLKDFSEFDIFANKFTFSGSIWFLFDPSVVSLDTISKFSFEKGQILSASAPNTRIFDGKLLARYDVRVSLKANLSYKLFPFDSHVLYITIDNNFVTPGEIVFDSSYNEFAVAPEVATTGWILKSVFVNSGYSSSQLEREKSSSDMLHPRLSFALYYVHSGLRQALTIFLPLILIFFMAMFSLILNSETHYTSILALSSAAVTSLLAYRFVIENLAPKASYFMLSDYVFFLLLLATVLVYFLNTGLVQLREAHKAFLIITLHIAVIVSFIYLLQI